MADFKTLIADLARPFTLYAVGAATTVTTIIIALKVENGNDGAWVLGAAGATLTGLYAGKVIENYRVAASNAEVEKVRATVAPTVQAPPAATLPEKPSWK